MWNSAPTPGGGGFRNSAMCSSRACASNKRGGLTHDLQKYSVFKTGDFSLTEPLGKGGKYEHD